MSSPKQNLTVSNSDEHHQRTDSSAVVTMSRYFVWRFPYKNMLLTITEGGGRRSLLVLLVTIGPILKQYQSNIALILL